MPVEKQYGVAPTKTLFPEIGYAIHTFQDWSTAHDFMNEMGEAGWQVVHISDRRINRSEKEDAPDWSIKIVFMLDGARARH